MRRIILIILLLRIQNGFCQQSQVVGIVSLRNSRIETGKRIFIENAQVKDDFERANPTTTDRNGFFKLVFVGIEEKETVKFQVTKRGLEVVNIASLEVIAGQKDTVRISMAPPEKINEYRSDLYRIAWMGNSRNEHRRIYLEQRISQLLKDSVASRDEIIRLRSEYHALMTKSDPTSILAANLAEHYASINLDDVSPPFLKSFDLFKKGNFEAAQRIWNSVDLRGQAKMLIKEKKNYDEVEKGIERWGESLGQKQQDITQSIELNADIYFIRNQFDSSISAISTLLELDSANNSYLFKYALAFQWNKQHDSALKYYQKAIHIINSKGSSRNLVQSDDLASIYNNMAEIFVDVGEFDKARNLMLEASAIFRDSKSRMVSSFGTVNSLSVSLMNYGSLLAMRKLYDSAKIIYEDALRLIQEHSQGDTEGADVLRATLRENLGTLYKETKQFEKSKANLTESISIFSHYELKDSLKYARMLTSAKSQLGSLYVAEGEYTLAKELIQEAIRKYQMWAKYSPRYYNPRLAMVLATLGNLYLKINDFHKADESYSDAYALISTIDAENSIYYKPYLAGILADRGNIRRTLHDLKSARNDLFQALEYYRELHKIDSIAYDEDMSNLYHNIALLESDQANCDDAIRSLDTSDHLYREVMEARGIDFKPSLKRNDVLRGHCEFQRGNFRIAQNYLKDALSYYDTSSVTGFEEYRAMAKLYLGMVFQKTMTLALADSMVALSVEDFRRLSQGNLFAYGPYLGSALSYQIDLYLGQRLSSPAKGSLLEIIRLYDGLMPLDSNLYKIRKASRYLQIANIYFEMDSLEKSEWFSQNAAILYVSFFKTRDSLAGMAGASDSWFLLGKIRAKKWDLDGTQSFLMKAIELSKKLVMFGPKEDIRQLCDQEYYLAWNYFLRKDWHNAISLLNKVVKLYKEICISDSVHCQSELAAVFDLLGRNYWWSGDLALAEDQFSAVERLAPILQVTTTDSAAFLNATGNLLDIYNGRVDSIKDPKEKLIWINKMVHINKIRSDSFPQVSQFRSNYAKCLGRKSHFTLLIGRFNDAEETAGMALKIDPSMTWVNICLANALLYNGKYDSAIKIYRQMKNSRDARGKSFVQFWLEDFQEMEKYGYKAKGLDDIKQLLKE